MDSLAGIFNVWFLGAVSLACWAFWEFVFWLISLIPIAFHISFS